MVHRLKGSHETIKLLEKKKKTGEKGAGKDNLTPKARSIKEKNCYNKLQQN